MEFTYEAIRRMSVLKLGSFFQLVGQDLAQQLTLLALLVMEEGDGNDGSAAQVMHTKTDTWKYSDLAGNINVSGWQYRNDASCNAKRNVDKNS